MDTEIKNEIKIALKIIKNCEDYARDEMELKRYRLVRERLDAIEKIIDCHLNKTS